MNLSALIQADAVLVQAHLDGVLRDHDNTPLVQAMRYALQGGKCLRAFLVLESARLHDIAPQNAISAAAAVEALHAYSLVHDDLPCMDDDDLRRGLPTIHVVWDEATAVLTGDALQTLAFELLCDPQLGTEKRRLALVKALAVAGGAQGMVQGQMLDIAAESAKNPLTIDEITRLQAGKTGALIGFSAMAGAILADAPTAFLCEYAQNLGLAFQITDDLLDVTGTSAQTGKQVGKDAAAGKATFVSLLGIEGARQRVTELIDQAKDALAPYGTRADNLINLAGFVMSRES